VPTVWRHLRDVLIVCRRLCHETKPPKVETDISRSREERDPDRFLTLRNDVFQYKGACNIRSSNSTGVRPLYASHSAPRPRQGEGAARHHRQRWARVKAGAKPVKDVDTKPGTEWLKPALIGRVQQRKGEVSLGHCRRSLPRAYRRSGWRLPQSTECPTSSVPKAAHPGRWPRTAPRSGR